jgi:hypothetical protein
MVHAMIKRHAQGEDFGLLVCTARQPGRNLSLRRPTTSSVQMTTSHPSK